MSTSSLVAALVIVSGVGASIPDRVVEKQETTFERFWGTEFVWKFEDLPTKGQVPDERIPYSGYIYPDTAGGTSQALRKYDMAFNGRRMQATAHEHWDTTAYKQPTPKRAGLFGLRTRTVMETPGWHGHCNGWAAAAIRHAEPQQSVRRGGVVFSPADIKGLLAEIYIYNDLEHLLGLDDSLNAGAFHAIIANWVGRGSHGLGMEADPGKEKWNYPIYGFSTSSAKRSDREVEVKMNLSFVNNSNGEYQQSPRIQRVKFFHYVLNLDDEGKITGGYFYRDSSMIDMLWVPLRPKKSREKGNEQGNPYVDVDQVLAVWRDSVPEDVRKTWPVIDPPEEDRITEAGEIESLMPVQEFLVAEATEVAEGDGEPAGESTTETASEENASEENASEETESAVADAGAVESANE